MGLLDNTTQQQYYDGSDFGNYQFVSLDDIINQFMIVYVGEDKLISKASRVDVAFHAQRGLAEMSFDTFKSTKAQEIAVPASLQMILPHDYVNYTKVSWVDSSGIKHLLYPTTKTSNPTNPRQNDGSFPGNEDAFAITAKWSTTAILGEILLDGQYDHILAGMIMSNSSNVGFAGSAGLNGLTVLGTRLENSSTVVLVDGAIFSSTSSSANVNSIKRPVQFRNQDGSLLVIPDQQFTVNGIGVNAVATDSREVIALDVTGGLPDNIEKVRVGMLVSHKAFIPGTTVTSILLATSNGSASIITLSNPALYTTGNSYDQTMTFTSVSSSSDTWGSYKSSTPNEDQQDNYIDDTYWPMDGSRYGLDPQHAQANGSFYINDSSGKIHFSSNIAGKTVILDYISDSLGTNGEMQVHKLAEEAMYKCIAHGVLSGKSNIPEYQVNRLKKERFAAVRTAKLRLSNIKLEELTQILRGKSKQIKH